MVNDRGRRSGVMDGLLHKAAFSIKSLKAVAMEARLLESVALPLITAWLQVRARRC